MNLPYIVISVLLIESGIGILIALYGLGMAKGWWK